MKSLVSSTFFVLLIVLLSLCTKKAGYPFKVNEVSPWCILDFDSLDRTPKQRIAMLKEMGFEKYGFNRGKGDLGQMKEEFKLAKENDIEIISVFLWLNAKRDSIGKLSPSNRELLHNLEESEQKPTIWLSFSQNFFDERSHEESVKLSIEMIRYIKLQADKAGCQLALYNHHGWFGDPYHQIELLEKMNQDSLTMVFNFHHAHAYVDEFPEIAKQITPYLSYVNLNGVKKEGPQILTPGKGDYEYEMIRILMEEGYQGPWGILGHIKTEDVQKVLERNVDGLKLMNSRFSKEYRHRDQREAGRMYHAPGQN